MIIIKPKISIYFSWKWFHVMVNLKKSFYTRHWVNHFTQLQISGIELWLKVRYVISCHSWQLQFLTSSPCGLQYDFVDKQFPHFWRPYNGMAYWVHSFQKVNTLKSGFYMFSKCPLSLALWNTPLFISLSVGPLFSFLLSLFHIALLNKIEFLFLSVFHDIFNVNDLIGEKLVLSLYITYWKK